MDLSSEIFGIPIRNPLVVGSSGLTNFVDKILELEKNGAGAIVLKSIFEEEIINEHNKQLKRLGHQENNLEFLDYYDYSIKDEKLNKYLKLIEEAKKKVNIPIIASINCVSHSEWVSFADKLRDSGVDGLELNIYVFSSNHNLKSKEAEKNILDIVSKVRSRVNLPLGIKISKEHLGMASFVQELDKMGVNGLVFFNRFYKPDINIITEEIVHSAIFSQVGDYLTVLRWVALLSGQVDCNIVASTGIYDGQTAIKQLLAGASAVEIVSAIYTRGPYVIRTMLDEIENWMQEKEYSSITDFRGKLNQMNLKDPGRFERVQFMKYFGDNDPF